jgi:hypothetical protein
MNQVTVTPGSTEYTAAHSTLTFVDQLGTWPDPVQYVYSDLGLPHLWELYQERVQQSIRDRKLIAQYGRCDYSE